MVEKVHGEINRVNHKKEHRKAVSEAGVRSDPAFCIRANYRENKQYFFRIMTEVVLQNSFIYLTSFHFQKHLSKATVGYKQTKIWHKIIAQETICMQFKSKVPPCFQWILTS